MITKRTFTVMIDGIEVRVSVDGAGVAADGSNTALPSVLLAALAETCETVDAAFKRNVVAEDAPVSPPSTPFAADIADVVEDAGAGGFGAEFGADLGGVVVSGPADASADVREEILARDAQQRRFRMPAEVVTISTKRRFAGLGEEIRVTREADSLLLFLHTKDGALRLADDGTFHVAGPRGLLASVSSDALPTLVSEGYAVQHVDGLVCLTPSGTERALNLAVSTARMTQAMDDVYANAGGAPSSVNGHHTTALT